MTKLIIKELARADPLDGEARAAVHGGWSLNPPGLDDGYSPRGGLPIHPEPGDRSIIYLENPAAKHLPCVDRARDFPTIGLPGQITPFAY